MSIVYNQFSSEYNELFIRNIQEFIATHKEQKLEEEYYDTFYPSFGITPEQSCDFLIIGQAPKGWRTGFYTDDEIATEKIISDAIYESNKFCKEHKHTPIDWVNVYWTKSLFLEHIKDNYKKTFYLEGEYYAYRSFFWKVTYKLISDFYNLDRDECDWAKKIVWSNLYKIAPENANPNGIQMKIQLKNSIRLIQKEIEELKPKYCIVITGKNWWDPFQQTMNTQKITINPKLDEIVSLEKYLDTHIVVTTRPFLGGGEKHVKQILELIK